MEKEKKHGIIEAERWHNIVSIKKNKFIRICLPEQILKKERVTTYPDSKYFVRDDD